MTFVKEEEEGEEEEVEEEQFIKLIQSISHGYALLATSRSYPLHMRVGLAASDNF